MADKRELIKLLKYLKIDFKDLKPDWDGTSYNYNFDNRLRIQKIVYIISKATKQIRYNYTLYLRGPYSKSLAKDYFNISSEEWKGNEELTDKSVIDMADFLNKKDNLWLEIGSTFIMMYSSGNNKKKAVERTYDFKNDVLNENNKDINYVEEVVSELKKHNLFKCE